MTPYDAFATDRMLSRARASSRWPRECFRPWQERHLKRLLRHAYDNVPLYRALCLTSATTGQMKGKRFHLKHGTAHPVQAYWDSSKNEATYLISQPGAEFDYDIDVSMRIAFGEIETVAGRNAPATLSEMTKIVEDILNALEAEARRIGIFR